MNELHRKFKHIVRKTPLFKPIKYIAAMFGYGTFPLPFNHTEAAEPFLERAMARIGEISRENRNSKNFYSYFSEIWSENYDDTLEKQYATYLPFIKNLPHGQFLDIGCGAGEFIDYLSQNNIPSEGIDKDIQEVKRATDKGLIAYCTDAITHLKESQKKYSGVSLLEVIEHINNEDITFLLSKIFESLVPGGAILIETINIKHPVAFHTFYTDITHHRPVPSDLLVFLLQWHGFVDAKIIYTNPLAYSLSQSNDFTRAYFNYAVCAKKPS